MAVSIILINVFEVNELSSAVTVCPMVSLFFHPTVVPFTTLIVAGLYAEPVISSAFVVVVVVGVGCVCVFCAVHPLNKTANIKKAISHVLFILTPLMKMFNLLFNIIGCWGFGTILFRRQSQCGTIFF